MRPAETTFKMRPAETTGLLNAQLHSTHYRNVPDEHTLVVGALPQRSVALISNGVDVRRNFTQVMSTVSFYGCGIIQT